MKCCKMLVVLVLLIVNCAIADDQKCKEGNCTVGIDANVQHNDSKSSSDHHQHEGTEGMQPIAVPTAMNMLADDNIPAPTSTPPSIFVTPPSSTPTVTPKGRAINFTLEEQHTENGILANGSSNTPTKSYKDLSDVSMDDDEDDFMQKNPILSSKLTESGNYSLGNAGICVKGGLTYSHGEKIEDGCETICTCMNGKMDCVDRCVGPYFRKGKKINDPLCTEKAVEDPCCSILVCAADTETEPLEMCSHQNKTYHRGEKFYDGCSQVCMCEAAGKVNCKPRCHAVNKTSDSCLEVTDPSDSCCKMVLCDVTLDDHEHDKEDIPKIKLMSAKLINSSTILFKFDSKLDEKNNLPDVEVSQDKINWVSFKVMPGGYLQGFKSDVKFARLENTNDYIMIQNADLGLKNQDFKKDDGTKTCTYDGEQRKLGEEFYDNCTSFCKCLETGVKCLKIQCPTYFGLDAVDPTCLEWETVPADFVPKAPNCCPEKVQCKTNGSCLYEGVMYHNWAEIPSNITGCEKRCYCELGKVECHSACPPVPATPPPNLPCPPQQAILTQVPDDDCCMAWMCTTLDPSQGTDDKTTKKTDKQRLDGLNNRTKKPFPPLANITHDDSSDTSDFEGPLLKYENDKPVKSPNKTIVHESSDLQNLHMEHNGPLNPKPLPGMPNHFDHDQYENNDEEPSYMSPWPQSGGHKPTKDETFVKPIFENQNNDEEPYMSPWPVAPGRKPSKDEISAKPLPESPSKSSSYAGPFNPDFKTPSNPTIKPKKGNKTSNLVSPNKEKGEQIFSQSKIPQGLPYNLSNTRPVTFKKQKTEQVVPHYNIPQELPYRPQETQYTNIQHPEEVLQIINQHPELANYPSGSVFEIHNIQQKPINSGSIPPNRYNQNGRPPPSGPYLINQVEPDAPNVNTNLNPTLPIDQIIKHVQGGQIPSGIPRPVAPYFQNTQFSQNPIFAPPGLQFSVLNNQAQLNQSTGFGGFPGRFPNGPGGYQQSPDEINVQQVEAIDGQTVRLIFTVSPLIVGLHGRVEVRYTNKRDDNLANWELQVFAPPNDLIATQQLEFDLIGLQPNSDYKIKITVILRDLHNTPSSRIYNVRTPAQTPLSTMPPMIPIEPNLVVTDVNSTWANLVWRKLNEFELQFVDGVQLRFKEITGKVYAATPLIHRAVTSYTIENLKSDTEYEVGIFFIPFTGQTTELHADNMVHFTTTPEVDPYGFNVTLDIQLVKATTVDIAWSGVPYPEDKYVNIYRAIYQSDSGKGDFSTFKMAKRDSATRTTIEKLKPGTRYRLWLEVYLTNGKIKTSNVQDFITKPRAAPALDASSQQGKLSSSEEAQDHSNDYYGPLVVVAILAAIAILSTLILLMILLRRHSQNKAPISTPTRVSQAAYDNPTYKVEIQQETMGL